MRTAFSCFPDADIQDHGTGQVKAISRHQLKHQVRDGAEEWPLSTPIQQMFHRRRILRVRYVELLLRWHQTVLRSVRADGDQTNASGTSSASSRMVKLEKRSSILSTARIPSSAPLCRVTWAMITGIRLGRCNAANATPLARTSSKLCWRFTFLLEEFFTADLLNYVIYWVDHEIKVIFFSKAYFIIVMYIKTYMHEYIVQSILKLYSMQK